MSGLSLTALLYLPKYCNVSQSWVGIWALMKQITRAYFPLFLQPSARAVLEILGDRGLHCLWILLKSNHAVPPSWDLVCEDSFSDLHVMFELSFYSSSSRAYDSWIFLNWNYLRMEHFLSPQKSVFYFCWEVVAYYTNQTVAREKTEKQ